MASNRKNEELTLTYNLKETGARAVAQAMRDVEKRARALESMKRRLEAGGFKGVANLQSDTVYDSAGKRVGAVSARYDGSIGQRNRDELKRENDKLSEVLTRAFGAKTDKYVDQAKLTAAMNAPVKKGDAASARAVAQGIQEVLGPDRNKAVAGAIGDNRRWRQSLVVESKLDAYEERLAKAALYSQKKDPARAQAFADATAQVNAARSGLAEYAQGVDPAGLDRAKKELAEAHYSVGEKLKETEGIIKKENDEAKKNAKGGFASYIGRFGITAAARGVGAAFGNMATGFASNGQAGLQQAPFQMAGAIGQGAAGIGQSMLIRNGLKSVGGWATMGAGMVLSAVAGMVGALNERGRGLVDDATTRVGGGDIVMGSFLRNTLGRQRGRFREQDYQIKETDYATVSNMLNPDGSSPDHPLSGIFNLIGNTMAGRPLRRDIGTGLPWWKRTDAEEVRKRRNEQELSFRQTMLADTLGEVGIRDFAGAMNETLGGSAYSLDGKLGGARGSRAETQNLANLIRLGGTTGAGFGRVGAYAGGAASGYMSGGMSPLRTFIAAAQAADYSPSEFLDQIITTQKAGAASGLVFDSAGEARLANSFVNGGVSGGKLGAVSASMMQARTGARGKLTAGGADLAEGLALVRAFQSSDGTLGGAITALDNMSAEQQYTDWEGMGPDLHNLLLANAGLGGKDLKAAKDRFDEDNPLYETDVGAYAKAQVGAYAEAKSIAYANTSSEMASSQELVDALNAAAVAVNKWMASVTGTTREQR